MEKKLTVISLGVGVQSSTMALMAAHGEIGPMPDCAIFADTGAEPDHIYEYLEYLRPLLPFPIHVVKHKDGLKVAVEQAATLNQFDAIPTYQRTEKNEVTMGRRQCTREYKITPITQEIRRILGLKPRQKNYKEKVVEQWVGISLDEIQRMKDNREKWIENRWPLIEQNMTRWHCLQWMENHGYRLPQKSSCTFCPYRDDKAWAEMKRDDPKSFAEAVQIDSMLNVNGSYVHRSAVPLADVDFSYWERQKDMFNDPYSGGFNQECDGMCGV